MNQIDHDACLKVIESLRDDAANYQYFNAPAISALPEDKRNEYLRIIKNPMDLETVRTKLLEDQYTSLSEFEDDADKFQKTFKNLFDSATNKSITKKMQGSSTSESRSSKSNAKRSKETVKEIEINVEPVFEGDIVSKCEKLTLDIMNLNDAMKLLHHPVDITVYNDYTGRVKNPIDFNCILDRIKGKSKSPPQRYSSLNQVALDIRRAIGNFIRYNYYVSAAKLRKQAISALTKFENQWKEIQRHVLAITPYVVFKQPLPDVISCLEAIDDTLKTPSTLSKSVLAIEGFMYPVEFSFGGSPEELKRYNQIIVKAMDFSTIISNLTEAVYNNIDQVREDVRLIATNCRIYWSTYGDDAEKVFIDNAAALEVAFMKSLEERLKKNQPFVPLPPPSTAIPISAPQSSTTSKPSSSGTKANSKTKVSISSAGLASLSSSEHVATSAPSFQRHSSTTSISSAVPSSSQSKEESAASIQKRASKYLNELFKRALEEVKNHYLMSVIDGQTRIYTARPFLKAVDPSQFPDYAQIIHNPMDLNRIEKRLAGGRYESIGSILKDMQLIRDNAYAYNTDKDSIEVPIMADALLDYFKYLLKTAITDLYLSLDDNLANAVVDETTQSLLHLPDAESVIKYLSHYQEEKGYPFRFQVTSSSATNNVPMQSTSAAAPSSSTKRPKEHAPITILPQETAMEPLPTGAIAEDDLDLRLFDDTSISFAAPPKKGGKGSKGKKASNVPEGIGFQSLPLVPIRDKLPWESACEKVLNTLCKHPYVDLSNNAVVSNFHVPVIEVFPTLAEEYLKLIPNPMDLTTLRTRLDSFSILDAEEFYNMAVSIFQNALDYNEYQEKEAESRGVVGPDMNFYKHRTPKYKHLVRYTKWLGLEMPRDIALVDDIGKENPEKFGNLRYSLQDQARKERETYLKEAYIDRNVTGSSSGLSECDKLLKALKRSANNTEKGQIEYFTLPFDETMLADYYVYVKKPMDLSTVKYKLDNTLPTLGTKYEQMSVINKIREAKAYTNFGDFIDDLRRIFTNAIKYNGVHRVSDTTGLSQKVYDAALFMQERLERLLPDFTLTLTDRLERRRLKHEEEGEREERKRLKVEKIESTVAQYEQQEKEKLLAEDVYYAADQDVERKKELTRQQLIASRLVKKQKFEELSMKKLGYVDDDFMDSDALDLDDVSNRRSSEAMEGDIDQESKRTAYESQLAEEKRLLKLKDQMRIPLYFVKLLEKKRKIRDIAWKHWEPYAMKQTKAMKSSQSTNLSNIHHIGTDDTSSATEQVLTHVASSDVMMDTTRNQTEVPSEDSRWVDVTSERDYTEVRTSTIIFQTKDRSKRRSIERKKPSILSIFHVDDI